MLFTVVELLMLRTRQAVVFGCEVDRGEAVANVLLGGGEWRVGGGGGGPIGPGNLGATRKASWAHQLMN